MPRQGFCAGNYSPLLYPAGVERSPRPAGMRARRLKHRDFTGRFVEPQGVVLFKWITPHILGRRPQHIVIKLTVNATSKYAILPGTLPPRAKTSPVNLLSLQTDAFVAQRGSKLLI